MLEALQPSAVVGYLRSNGWDKTRDYGSNGAIFGIKSESQEAELIVPIERQARDYSAVMELLIDDLAKFETRSSYDVLNDLSIAGYDVIQVRSPEADEIGSVLLTAGVELHERARDMLRYAANVVASNSHRANWRGRPSEGVESYLGQMRLGQTKRGSFVISLLSPWEFQTPSESQQLDLADVPFGRRTTQVLGNALVATAQALRRAVTEDPVAAFRPAINEGVSSNLCQSLADIAQNGDGADISIRWSYNKPEALVPMLRLRRDDVQILRSAAQGIAASEPISDQRFEGIVTHMQQASDAPDGVTTIDAIVDGKLKKVRIEFDALSNSALRTDLIKAFDERKRVSIVGDLSQEGRRLLLKNPRELTFLEAAENE